MEVTFSFDTINCDTSGPGAFMRAAKWYWDEVTDMASAAGFTSIANTLIPNTENVARNGAPVCTASITTRYGSPEGYRNYLNSRGIDHVAAFGISAQKLTAAMAELGLPFSSYFTEFYKYADDVMRMLAGTGGKILTISPTPNFASMRDMGGITPDKYGEFLSATAECINKIGKKSKEYGIQVCLKNDFWTLVHGNHIGDFLDSVDTSLIALAPDTASTYIEGADVCQLIRQYADLIKCVYLTDTKFKDNNENFRSLSPEYPQIGMQQRTYNDLGYGNVDFKSVYKALEDIHFDGLVILESRNTLDVPKGILRCRTFWNHLTSKY